MSDIPATEMEVEESGLVGGGESLAHLMEPQVELDEDLDHSTLEPNIELDENLAEPHIEFHEGAEQNDNVYSYDAFQYYGGQVDSTVADDYQDGILNGQDSSQCSTSLDNSEIMDTSNTGITDSSFKEDDDTNYNEMQRTYLKDFFSSSASPTTDESSNPSLERIPLSRFPSIVKVVERAEYETIQILYQLLYQRSAWDTQEILSKRILEFSGFNFGKNSEEYYNREMTLQTLPNSVLVKIGAILCLDQVKNVLSNVGLGRHDLINAIMEFLSLPKKKTRASRIQNNASANSKLNSKLVEPCGCRNNCLSKFSSAERELLATHHTTLKKKVREAYFLGLIDVKQATKRPGDDAKKHRDYKYSYKIKLGKKEINVCKGGFMMLFNVKMSMLNQVQMTLKSEKYSKSLVENMEYPCVEGEEEDTSEETSKNDAAKEQESKGESITAPVTNSGEESTELSSSKIEETISKDDIIKVDPATKKSVMNKIPAVVVEKIDPNKLNSPNKNNSSVAKKDSSGTKKDLNAAEVSEKTEVNVKKKLRDFPLVVKSLEDASETLLIDLHFLLFSSSADSDKLKDNILDFDGFPFSADSEEYDERNEFLQRMSGKLLTDVARSFSLGVMSKREETIENILSFLMKPDESYLRTTATVPVILSDVELDDIDGFSDSDESITCEVVEKKVECIDLLSSGDESEKESKKKSGVKTEKSNPPSTAVSTASVPAKSPSVVTRPVSVPSPSVAPSTPAPVQNTPESGDKNTQSSGGVRRLRDFETIRKIVNTHPPEYLVDIYELLFLKKHDPATLRNEILDFSGFTFEKGSQDYVKRKQVLDRMLYNNVRRVYNTLIHNSTEVKVFSKPTMINEIFQFLFKLPDHDTSVRPLPPGAKTLMPKAPSAVPTTKLKPTPVTNAPLTTAPASILPSPSGKLSDLKRVFQRVACFPCEYLVDVHKLLFMTDCDPKVIRQNIFGFKGFSFGVDSTEFQQRKMYLEYLTFHSLRKISSVLTTRSVDLRNSTKHELASHLTDVLAEYCNTVVDADAPSTNAASKDSSNSTSVSKEATPTSSMETIVVTPIIEGIQSVAPSKTVTTSPATPSISSKSPKSGKSSASDTLKISIVETRSISSPAVSTTSGSTRGRKRKNQSVKQVVSEKKSNSAAAPAPQPGDFADIHLPEVEQYRQIYGANLNVFAEEYAEFFESPVKYEKSFHRNKKTVKRNWTAKKRKPRKSSAGCAYITVNDIDIEKIKKIKWIVVLEKIDLNVIKQYIQKDPFFPKLKMDQNAIEDTFIDHMSFTSEFWEGDGYLSPEPSKTEFSYKMALPLRDIICNGNVSIKNAEMDASIKDPTVPTITGIASFGTPVSQTFPQLVPQAVTFPIVTPYSQHLQVSGIQQSPQVIGLQSTALTMTSPIITQVTSKPPEVIVPADIEHTSPEPQKTQAITPTEKSDVVKESPSKDKDHEEDGDQPLSALIGHPTDAVLKKHISDIVEKTDLQDITMNGVIQRIYDMYPKFDLSYRKDFIKSTLRTILYKLGNKSEAKEGTRDTNSPDCSVTTTDMNDSNLECTEDSV